MKIKEIIATLEKYQDKDQQLIIAWWGEDMFENKKEFEYALENEEGIDWSDVHDQMTEDYEDKIGVRND